MFTQRQIFFLLIVLNECCVDVLDFDCVYLNTVLLGASKLLLN